MFSVTPWNAQVDLQHPLQSRDAGAELDQVLAAQNEEGVWTRLSTEPGAQGSYNIGTYFILTQHRAYGLLSLLERSRILTGEIQRDVWRFPGLIHDSDYPMHYRNWMDLSKQ